MDDERNPVTEAFRVVAVGTGLCVDAPLPLSDVRALLAPAFQVVDEAAVTVANLSPVSVFLLEDKDAFCPPHLTPNKAGWILAEKVVT